MITDKEQRAYQQLSSNANKLIPVLRRHGLNETADRWEVLTLKLRKIFPILRDVEMLNETGCCCGHMRGNRTNRELCEACVERAGNGGSY